MKLPFPNEGLVYDYKLDEGGITLPACDDEDEEDALKARVVSHQPA